MREYITGGSGFIGTALRKRIPDLIRIPHEEIRNFNLLPYSRLFFLSAYGNLHGQTEVENIIKANVLDPVHLFLKDRAFNSFVYISSSSCKLPVKSDYACSKLAAEQYFTNRNLPVCIIRPYSVTGVGEQRQHLIPSLIRSCMEGEPISLTPKPTHDFIDVKDVCAGIDLLSAQRATGIFELGRGAKYSNGEVLKIVESVTGRNANVRFVNTVLREYDNDDWVCRDTRAQEFGWRPTKSLETSITQMVKAYCEEKA